MSISLTRTRMRKSGLACTFIGMAHSALPELYHKVQTEIDAAHARGDQIFYEGIVVDLPTTSTQTTLVMQRIKRSLDKAEERVSKTGYVRETQTIRLPPSAVRADMHAVDIISAHQGNSLVLYGQAHMLGMMLIMMVYGWTRETHEPYYTLETLEEPPA
jgi:hypothetical protein